MYHVYTLKLQVCKQLHTYNHIYAYLFACVPACVSVMNYRFSFNIALYQVEVRIQGEIIGMKFYPVTAPGSSDFSIYSCGG